MRNAPLHSWQSHTGAIVIFFLTTSFAGARVSRHDRSPVAPASAAARPAPPAPATPPTPPPAPVAAEATIDPGDLSAVAPRRSPLDEPTADAWPALARWDDRTERDWSAFVSRLDTAVQARRCNRLDACLRDPAANALFDATTDARLRLDDVDCADLPYILRAYFSWRRHLPFVHAGAVRGEPDPRGVRYAANIVPADPRRSSDYATPRSVFHDVGSTVHSGFFRLRPELEDTDTYPARVDRQGVRPGTAHYDPDGHVLVVYDVAANGEVRLIDGHPGGSFTARRFSRRLTLGSSAQGGGFRNFRPVILRNGAWTRPRNADLPDYDRAAQHDPSRWVVGGQPVGYQAWVRDRLVRHM